jgi:hypothetical protein
LVLNGVGGCSVEEAKERLSHEETLKWQAYMEKRGPLDLGLRMEMGFALIAWMINRALGGKAEIEDFTPHVERAQASLSDVMNILSGKQK